MNEYHVELLNVAGQPLAGASFPAQSAKEAEEEARALALMHDWAVTARLHRKGGLVAPWTIDLGRAS